MEVREKAKLFRDAKGLWRLKAVHNAKQKDKGMPVPPTFRSNLTEDDDGKTVTVVKVDGQINKLIFEGGEAQEVVKQDAHKMQVSEQSTRPTMHGDVVSSVAKDDSVKSCAVLAYECALCAQSLGKEYKTHAKSLSMMIRTNGLGTTMAYLESKDRKDGKHFERLKEDIMRFLRKIEPSLNEENVFSQCLAAKDSHVIKELTKEALFFLGWLSRFASGLIKG
jgi:CRISPR-associated protein Cmr5